MITNGLVIKSIDYIMQHLDEELTIEEVADYCHLSKYYFSRVFKAETGESMYAFIKRLKMEQSAFRLKVEKDKSITDIGYDYGYSPSNYSSVFKKHNNISPVKFRKGKQAAGVPNPFFQDRFASFQSFAEYDKQISIQKLDEYMVIYERYIGNYIELGKNWRDFTEKYKDYVNEDTILLERSYADPAVTSIDKCIYDICMTVDNNCSLDNVTTIQSGNYAVYHFEGLVQDIFAVFQGLCNIWLADSGYEMDERYVLARYRSIDWNNMQVAMDLCIPIK